MTNSSTRALMLNRMANELRHSQFNLNDQIIKDQCFVFVRKENGAIEADGSFLDDGVIATAIAGQVIDEFPYKSKRDTGSILSDMPLRTRKNAGF